MKRKIVSIPPTYFLACLVVTVLLRLFLPSLNWIQFPWNLTGILFLAAGACLVALAHQSLTRHATPVNFAPSTCIIQEGLYRHSRNPMYLGFLAFLLGVSIVSGNILALLCPVFMFCVLNWMFILYEEEKMEKTFNREYLEYKQNVRRWL